MSPVDTIKAELLKKCDKSRADKSQRFFKTGPGEYGEGDVFIGVSVPDQRKVAKKYTDMSLVQISKLLHSHIHEHRLVAIFILVYKFRRASVADQKLIYQYYLDNTKYINNWDIIDSSAGYIVGEYLYSQKDDKSATLVLARLAKSSSIWERRIAIMSTFAYTIHGNSRLTLEIADILIHDEHDLVQKAVGWMLREVGKRISRDQEEEFLKSRYQTMPRTMLRYAIERFAEPKRQMYLKSQI